MAEIDFQSIQMDAHRVSFIANTLFFWKHKNPQLLHLQISYAFLHCQRVAGDKAVMHYFLVEKPSSFPQNQAGT